MSFITRTKSVANSNSKCKDTPRRPRIDKVDTLARILKVPEDAMLTLTPLALPPSAV